MAHESQDTISIGDYLLERLSQIGVQSLFGVPGDFNLACDLVEDHPNIDWIGNCNELNAAYAADGYARVKHGSIGAVLTTFGVGELSAINGIAGAFSEHVPVVHIVGVPSTEQQTDKPMLHHTLGDGRYDAYLKAAQQVTWSQGAIFSTNTAASEIDRVLTDCITSARPVYLTLPTDRVFTKIPRGKLDTPLLPHPPKNDPDTEEFALNEIQTLVEQAGSEVVILVDACTIRHDVTEEVWELIQRTGFPVYSAPMGKTAVPEDFERYGGIYVGSLSHPEIKEKVENAKLVLSIGGLRSDFNTGNFTYRTSRATTVELHSDHTRVRYALYPGLGMKQLLPKLTHRLHPLNSPASAASVPPFRAILPKTGEDPLGEEVISHLYFWPRISQFVRPEDVVVTETGTSSFGALEMPLPAKTIYVSQILWGSIGWATGATLGAALAARERGLKGRTLLFTGEGSLQLTVQEFSTAMRHGLTPILFILNNRGYTIERHLHGMDRKYNDVVNWKWTQLLDSYTVHTKSELDALLKDESFANATGIQLVEVVMDKYDAPVPLLRQTELSGQTNHYAA
ncbi:pyruvate decarboxylase [Multifurca ochricompacta]|uniref:Pyruvate decarboxylase n=1 Tax=Multifurca ochricompacta TaxID=376703 RepID=A0AAD4QQE2_9AGAM|nr:pyruvate decarboxylase [Multifurca ochricompacta]